MRVCTKLPLPLTTCKFIFTSFSFLKGICCAKAHQAHTDMLVINQVIEKWPSPVNLLSIDATHRRNSRIRVSGGRKLCFRPKVLFNLLFIKVETSESIRDTSKLPHHTYDQMEPFFFISLRICSMKIWAQNYYEHWRGAIWKLCRNVHFIKSCHRLGSTLTLYLRFRAHKLVIIKLKF